MPRQLSRMSRGDDESDINLTPMLDVVFIMLIFFIVTATFIKQAGIDVFRPDAFTAESKPTVSVLVAVGKEGDTWIDKKKVETSAIRASIEKVRAENPRGSMVVQADREAPYKAVKAVLDAARAAGLTEVAISTES